MESEVLQTLQDSGLENPQAKVAEIKDYIKPLLEQFKEQILDHFSDKWGIGKKELEPVIHHVVSAGSISVLVSLPEPTVTHTKAKPMD